MPKVNIDNRMQNSTYFLKTVVRENVMDVEDSFYAIPKEDYESGEVLSDSDSKDLNVSLFNYLNSVKSWIDQLEDFTDSKIRKKELTEFINHDRLCMLIFLRNHLHHYGGAHKLTFEHKEDRTIISKMPTQEMIDDIGERSNETNEKGLNYLKENKGSIDLVDECLDLYNVLIELNKDLKTSYGEDV